LKRLWLVRHAESSAQTGESVSIDSPLSKLGILQAEQLKTVFADINIDITFISPLKRARETYEHSGINCKKVVFDSRLLEEMPPNSYSPLLPYEDLPAYGRPDIHNAWNLDSASRAKSFLNEIIESTEYDRILVISHSGILNTLLHSFLTGGKSGEDLYVGTNNCGISALTIGAKTAPKNTVLFWNSISHVRKYLGYDPMK